MTVLHHEIPHSIVTKKRISANDVVSRRAMLEGLRSVHGGGETLPFVRMFYSSPSRYLWEDQKGVVHTIDQGEFWRARGSACLSSFLLVNTVHWRQCRAVS